MPDVKAISPSGLGVRFAIAAGLVCLTWNPTPFNYVRWAMAEWSELAAVVFFVGLILLIAWIIFLRATFRSLGVVGILLGVAVAGSILWLLFEYDVVDAANRTALSWVVLVLLATLLAAGMSWSHLRRRWSGQADVDDIDEVG